jgi:hypothetical protein
MFNLVYITVSDTVPVSIAMDLMPYECFGLNFDSEI